MIRGRRRTVAGETALPADESVEQADRRLLALLDDGFERVTREAAAHLACRPGCSDCCHGPFPVTWLDVERLRRGLRELRGLSAERAAGVEERAVEASKLLQPGFPGDPASGRLSGDETELDRFFARHARLACPALDPESGRCELYASRPVACRTYGPPLRFGDESSAPCSLCFGEADAETVERCRLEPDARGLEEALLARLGVRAGEEWETLIAFALLVEPAP